MRSYTLPRFWDAYRRLPENVKRQAREAYRFFSLNPRHPSLDFKRVGRRSPTYSVRVNIDYRAVGVVEDSYIIWFWVGPHHEYDRLLRRM